MDFFYRFPYFVGFTKKMEISRLFLDSPLDFT